MLIIGDIHGNITRYVEILRARQPKSSLQVGDLGLGFSGHPSNVNATRMMETIYDPQLHERHKVLRGNHDNPEVFQRLKMYLGDWGYLPKQDLFFVSGAFSIDQIYRTPGLDWWRDEELSLQELTLAVHAYKEAKPRFVVTHDSPNQLYAALGAIPTIRNRTSDALQAMFEIHQPERWYFGHHHKSMKLTVGNTDFVCLAESEAVEDSNIPDF